MKAPYTPTLIPIEKQFANIKRLLPEINTLLSDAIRLEKVYKKRFAWYSEKWDLMQETIFHLNSFKHLTEKDRTFISTYVLGMMQKLIYAKRLSQKSRQTYHLAKTTLHELLLELTEQHKESGLRGDMPMFVQKHNIKLGIINRKREELRILMEKLKKRRTKQEDKVLVNLQKKKFPSILRQVFVRMNLDLKIYSQSEPKELLLLKEKISAFKKKKNAANRKSHKVEAAAFALIVKILNNHLEMLGDINTSFKDFHTEFSRAVQEG